MIKFTLTLVCIGMLLALAACTADANQTADIAADIADFDLPAGYTADFSAAVSGYSVIAYSPGDDQSHLYLIQSSQVADGDALEKGLADLVPGAGDEKARMTVIENRQVTVRGQVVTAVVSDGINSENNRYRQIMVVFEGKGGAALLVLSTPVNTWDETLVDTLLASIR
jgi:hypothetical protein